LIAAQFPRIYCDPNRQAWELDPRMYSDSLPKQALTRSPRIANGLGTIARYAANGQSIYKSLLKLAEAEQRIQNCYKPYHSQLQDLLKQGVRRFGFVVLIDCHSMPSRSRINGKMKDNQRADFVLGDRFGQSCHPDIMELATEALQNLGYDVTSNIPYAGGFITENYGQPDQNIHGLQIEINRRLYMDEMALTLIPDHLQLIADLAKFIQALGRISLPARMNAAE
jgi:N-formylglutamate amidohydrolase